MASVTRVSRAESGAVMSMNQCTTIGAGCQGKDQFPRIRKMGRLAIHVFFGGSPHRQRGLCGYMAHHVRGCCPRLAPESSLANGIPRTPYGALLPGIKIGGGDGTRTRGLRVMSATSYQLLYPATNAPGGARQSACEWRWGGSERNKPSPAKCDNNTINHPATNVKCNIPADSSPHRTQPFSPP